MLTATTFKKILRFVRTDFLVNSRETIISIFEDFVYSDVSWIYKLISFDKSVSFLRINRYAVCEKDICI